MGEGGLGHSRVGMRLDKRQNLGPPSGGWWFLHPEANSRVDELEMD